MMRKLMMAAAMAVFSTVAVAQTVPVDGEILKIDPDQNKVTVKHGPIKNLDMDAMTMVFAVADPAMLKAVKAGDNIKFEVDRVNCRLTVTKMEKKK